MPNIFQFFENEENYDEISGYGKFIVDIFLNGQLVGGITRYNTFIFSDYSMNKIEKEIKELYIQYYHCMLDVYDVLLS